MEELLQGSIAQGVTTCSDFWSFRVREGRVRPWRQVPEKQESGAGCYNHLSKESHGSVICAFCDRSGEAWSLATKGKKQGFLLQQKNSKLSEKVVIELYSSQRPQKSFSSFGGTIFQRESSTHSRCGEKLELGHESNELK